MAVTTLVLVTCCTTLTVSIGCPTHVEMIPVNTKTCSPDVIYLNIHLNYNHLPAVHPDMKSQNEKKLLSTTLDFGGTTILLDKSLW